MKRGIGRPMLFPLEPHPLADLLASKLSGDLGKVERRDFPDGESYLKFPQPVSKRHCVVVADLSHPNDKYLPLLFMLDTLRELGAASIGLVAPYLCYMRQDRRFVDGEAVTSRLFARDLSQHIDWLVTVDPHLHRYHSLDEIYSVPCCVVPGASALARWLETQEGLLLVGPDAESEQWVSDIARRSGHPFVIGEKKRLGDRRVEITLPVLDVHQQFDAQQQKTAVIIDDVISSGQTILQCIAALKAKGFNKIQCVAVHGIFADGVDAQLLAAGLEDLVTTNTIAHRSNAIDISELLVPPITQFLQDLESLD
ncbi:MAG: ribose-phosphate diphosphokinase [Porticoccaceae bacterium]